MNQLQSPEGFDFSPFLNADVCDCAEPAVPAEGKGLRRTLIAINETDEARKRGAGSLHGCPPTARRFVTR